MGMTALVVLASSLTVAAPAPLRLVAPDASFAIPMFQAPQGARGASGLRPLRAFLSQQASAPPTEPSPVCHIRTIKPDPGIDPAMAVEGPKGLDPKIVQRSACAEPAQD